MRSYLRLFYAPLVAGLVAAGLAFANRVITLPPVPSWTTIAGYWTMLVFLAVSGFLAFAAAMDRLLSVGIAPHGNKTMRALSVTISALNAPNRFRRRHAAFFYLILTLVLSSVFILVFWHQWWLGFGRLFNREPTSFLPTYLFLFALQVVGVVLTLVLVQRVWPDRVQSPSALFDVIHVAVSEAPKMAGSSPVVIHHIGPMPGLYEHLDSSLDDTGGTLRSVGPWRAYLQAFDAIGALGTSGGGPAPLIVAMVSYCQPQGAQRVYRGSSLYDFAVAVCKQSSPTERLLDRAERQAAALRAGGVETAKRDGVIRNWYHRLLFELLLRIEVCARAGQAEVWVRDVRWTAPVWGRPELGYTFIVRADDAYIGLPRVTPAGIRFDGKHVDFQYEAIRELESLVRGDARYAGPATTGGVGGWRRLTATDLQIALTLGDITAETES